MISNETAEKLCQNQALFLSLMENKEMKYVRRNARILRIAEEHFGDESFYIIIEILNDFGKTATDSTLIRLPSKKDVLDAIAAMKPIPLLSGEASGDYTNAKAAAANAINFE